MKQLLSSMTFRGGALAVASGITLVASLFGYEIESKEAEQIVTGILGIGSILGGLLSILGKIRSNKRLQEQK